MGEGEKAESRVGGEKGKHRCLRRGIEADVKGKKGEREGGRQGGGRRAVAGEEYPVGRRWGEGRRRFCLRGEGMGERGKK